MESFAASDDSIDVEPARLARLTTSCADWARHGTASGAWCFISPRTSGQRSIRSRFWPRTRHGFRARPRRSMCRSAKRCASTVARASARLSSLAPALQGYLAREAGRLAQKYDYSDRVNPLADTRASGRSSQPLTTDCGGLFRYVLSCGTMPQNGRMIRARRRAGSRAAL